MADGWLTTGAGGFPAGWFGAGATGLAGVGDLWSFFQNLGAKEQQQKLYGRMSNPAELMQYVNAIFKPMGDAENRAVQRDLGANWATMTGGAPGGAMNQHIADALAKIESQRYQDAVRTSMGALQGAGNLLPAQQPAGGSLGNVLKSLMALRGIMPNQQQGPSISTFKGGDFGYGPGTEQNVADYQPVTPDFSGI